MAQITRPPISIDKSHLITIGERLYSQSIELVRELVNNTYDADATCVEILLTRDAIVIEDNGSGMDLEGLKQYFNIGSTEKLLQPISPRFRRPRIGQFGIGKFASLAACRRFEVLTQEIALMKHPSDPRQAFSWQSRLLKDAFSSD